MKRIVIACLIFLGIANLAALYYLIKNQEKAQARLEEAIQKDIDERWQIAQSVQKQVQIKKQARDFIMRMDYDKQMEEYSQKLEGYKFSLEEQAKASLTRIGTLEAAQNQLNELTKQMESGFKQKLESNKKEFSALAEKQEKALKELKEINNQVKSLVGKMELSFERKLESFEKKIAALSDGLDALKVKAQVPTVSP